MCDFVALNFGDGEVCFCYGKALLTSSLILLLLITIKYVSAMCDFVALNFGEKLLFIFFHLRWKIYLVGGEIS